MWGAVIGDLAGSIYEFEQLKGIKNIQIQEIIPPKAFFSDDTILTIAIAEAIQNDKDYEKYLRKYGHEYKNYKPEFKPYFKTSFSPGYIKWLESSKEGTSCGNGAMMRISPIGYYFQTEQEVKENSRLATIPSHNSKEAIVYSTLIALIIFYAKQGKKKEEILDKLGLKLQYKKFDKFNTTCSQTFNNCIYAAFTSNSFEESISNIISYGGDTDTNACITGALSEALYGINPQLIEKAKGYIPKKFSLILENEYQMNHKLEEER